MNKVRELFCWLFIFKEKNSFLYLTWIFGFQITFFQLSAWLLIARLDEET